MGSARRYSDSGSVANRMNQDNKKQSAYARDNSNLYGYSTPGSSTQGLAPTNDKSKLSKIGGIMVGAIGHKSNRTIIDTGVANIDDELGTSTVGKTLIKIAGETSGGDTLDKLLGLKYEGQMAVLMNVSSADTITITHGFGAEGQFLCPGSVDYALGPYQSCLIFHDSLFTLDTWRIIDQPIASGSGVLIGDSPTWTGTHTFNGSGFQIGSATIVIGDSSADNLTINAKLQTAFLPDGNAIDLGDASNKWRNIYLNAGDGTSKIYFDGGGDTYMTGSGSSGWIGVYNNASLNTIFTTSGITTSALSMGGDITMGGNDITMGSSGDIKMAAGLGTSKLYFDGGTDTYITGHGTSGYIQVWNDGVANTSFTPSGIATTGISMAGDITMTSYDIDFTTGGRINFYDIVNGSALNAGGGTALPATPTSYFLVEYRGATRYIPYYST